MNGLPSSDTCPALGSSSPPSTCSSVLLPEPDAPTIASFSPRRTDTCALSSTCTLKPPCTNVFVTPRASSTHSRAPPS
ncbi:hypothetical protein [Burkholderia pseudomallei]|uniref:hypothetical protein n=1 Tax=Burkholderia pseudomallei TaxID=28450 RepID=UPI003C7DB423